MSGAIKLLRRIVTYAREDRARTPGFTRLARALEEAERFLQEEPAPDWQQLAARLAEALGDLTANADRIGGDGYGMPECPWCHAEGAREGDENWHEPDCELPKARETLAAYAAANSSKKLESSSRVTSRGPEGAR